MMKFKSHRRVILVYLDKLVPNLAEGYSFINVSLHLVWLVFDGHVGPGPGGL